MAEDEMTTWSESAEVKECFDFSALAWRGWTSSVGNIEISNTIQFAH